jgi:hypothetical protein
VNAITVGILAVHAAKLIAEAAEALGGQAWAGKLRTLAGKPAPDPLQIREAIKNIRR